VNRNFPPFFSIIDYNYYSIRKKINIGFQTLFYRKNVTIVMEFKASLYIKAFSPDSQKSYIPDSIP